MAIFYLHYSLGDESFSESIITVEKSVTDAWGSEASDAWGSEGSDAWGSEGSDAWGSEGSAVAWFLDYNIVRPCSD